MWSNALLVSVACKFYSEDIYFSMSYIPFHSFRFEKECTEHSKYFDLPNFVIFMALVKECYIFFYLFALTNLCR
jgi:hypothetical protein